MLAHAEIPKHSGSALPAPHKKEAAGLRLLNVNHFILESVQVLRRMVKKRVRLQAVLADRDVRIMADWAKMSQVFATIVAYGSEIIKKGGTITILARLLPIENALVEKGGGRCALLSVSARSSRSVLPMLHPSDPHRALTIKAGQERACDARSRPFVQLSGDIMVQSGS
ncbi:hypothetical protein SBDP2_1690001 [Syntrophobacter sp. SbD2]|nr:hypothetical protein SBDP2_1690001 [Syntrophobacter sp. SbD2]